MLICATFAIQPRQDVLSDLSAHSACMSLPGVCPCQCPWLGKPQEGREACPIRSVCSFCVHVPQSRRADARGVMLRLLQIALALSMAIAAVLVAGRHRLPLVFTRDAAVAQLVAAVLPLIAACMVRCCDTVAALCDALGACTRQGLGRVSWRCSQRAWCGTGMQREHAMPRVPELCDELGACA